jgi:hypothetical protein
MARRGKAQRETDRFRSRVSALLDEPDDWEYYEHIRGWLQKLLQPDRTEPYTPAERAAVERIIRARTPFDGWDGFSVPELLATALRYVADYSYEDEVFLTELEGRGVTRLRMGDIGHVVGLCRIAGLDLMRFNPDVGEEAA